MRVIITGGSGFIGTNLVEHFVRRGDTVLSIDAAKPRNDAHRAVWQEVDLLNAKSLRTTIQDFSPDVLMHFGARTDLDGTTVDDYKANTEGVKNLISAVDGLVGLKRLVFASSRLVCRIGYEPRGWCDYCPTTAYGSSKVLGEQYVRAAGPRFGCPWVIVRPTSIWGPWFDVPYKTFFTTVRRGRYFHPAGRTVLKSFGFVGNTVHQLQRLLDVPATSVDGRTFYLGDYPPIDVSEMANTIQRTFGVPKIRTLDVNALRFAARGGDLLKAMGWRNPPITSFRLANLLTPMVHDLDALRDLVGELPFTMQQGVEITIRWLNANDDAR